MLLLVIVALALGVLSVMLLPGMRQHAAQSRAERQGDMLFQDGAFERAGEIWRAILAERPEAVSVRNKLAVLFMNSGRFEEAAALLSTGIELMPKAYSFHYNMGLLSYMGGRHDDALVSLSEVERLCPGHGEVHYLKGMIYKEQGLTEEAEREFIKELNVDPATPQAWSQVVAGLSPEVRRPWIDRYTGEGR